MTIIPIKQDTKKQFLNIFNLPNSLPGKLLPILAQDIFSRRWEDVETLQKAAWNLTDNWARDAIGKVVSKAYDERYGTKPMKRDATGRQVMSDTDWTPDQNPENKKFAALALRLRPLSQREGSASVFRGVERGINILLGKKSFHVKVCGDFEDKTQNVFQELLQRKPYKDIFQAVKTGMITDTLLCYENRNMSTDEKKKKLSSVLSVFSSNQPEDENNELALYEDSDETVVTGDQGVNVEADVEEVIWHSTDSCGDCGQYNGRTFSIEDLPITHPNCLCTVTVSEAKRQYMRIYIKDNVIGHVRIEIVDENGNRTIRGLNKDWIGKGETIYEKGEKDSSNI